MSILASRLSGAVGLLLVGAVVARADSPPNPLQMVPAQADLVLQVESPRKLVEAFTTLDLFKRLQKFDAVQEAMDSTNYRRFYQLVAYFERQLGARWPELLDRLGGGGAVLAVKLGPNAPALVVLQSKDEELLKKFVTLGTTVIEQELARQDAKERVEKGSYRDRETLRIGKGFHAAVVGPTLLLANKEAVLKRSLDLALDGGKGCLAGSASVAEAKKLLPAQPLASLWLNLETVHKAPPAKEIFKLPRNDANLTVLFGGLLDVAGRSPFLAAALVTDDAGFTTTIRFPRGRDGSAEALTTHIPPTSVAGSLPLLEPKGVILSSSYYLDVAKFWDNRARLFNDKQKKAFEDFDKTAGRFLAGNSIGKLLGQAGPHQRIVVAHQPKAGYQSQPDQRLPAFAFVVDTRDEKFGRSMETILRGAALLAGARFKLKLAEEKVGGVDLVAYRFPDDPKKPPQNNIVFNFSPCFAQVGNQFFAASTIELGRELVGLLQKEAKEPAALNPAASRSKVYASGGADLLQAIEDQLFAQAILERALPPEQAKQEARHFIQMVRGLGGIGLESIYNREDFRYDLRIQISHRGHREHRENTKK